MFSHVSEYHAHRLAVSTSNIIYTSLLPVSFLLPRAWLSRVRIAVVCAILDEEVASCHGNQIADPACTPPSLYSWYMHHALFYVCLPAAPIHASLRRAA